jgi:hypothetical protein
MHSGERQSYLLQDIIALTKTKYSKCDSPLGVCSSPQACQRCVAALSHTPQLQRPEETATAQPQGSDCHYCHLPYHTLLLHCLCCCCSTAVSSLSELLLHRCSAAEGSLHTVAITCTTTVRGGCDQQSVDRCTRGSSNQATYHSAVAIKHMRQLYSVRDLAFTIEECRLITC